MLNRPGFLLAILLSLVQAAQAQLVDPLEFTFKNFNSTTGLLGNTVNSVVQDQAGYFWIGTPDGLLRFDGNRFKIFRHLAGDSTSLPSNQVYQTMLDKHDRLWILLADGRVGIFDPRSLKFREAKVRPKKTDDLRYLDKRLITDEYGNVFLLIRLWEMLTWSETDNTFSQEHNFIPFRAGWEIEDMVQQPGTRRYFIALHRGGFAVYNNETGDLSYPGHNKEKEPIIERYGTAVKPYNIHIDQRQRIWFQFWESVIPMIYCYDLKENKPVLERYELHSQLRTYHEMNRFFEQRNGDIWVRGTRILARFDEPKKRFQLVTNGYTSNQSIDYDYVNCLNEDREGNIWVATNNNGVYIFNPANEFFTNVPHYFRAGERPKGSGTPTSFCHLRDGTVLSGTWGDGLYRYDSNWHEIPLHIKGIPNENFFSVWGLFASRDSNTIWISCQPGLYRYDQQTQSATYYNPPSLGNKTIRQVAEDHQGNLWLGLQYGGLRKWVRQNGASEFDKGIERFDEVETSQNINQIIVDSKGFVWVASAAYGAYMIDPVANKVALHFSAQEKGAFALPENGVTSVMEYDDSLMVITTGSRVILYNRNQETTTFIGAEETLSGNIGSIIRDKQGYVWVATSAGLYRVTLRNKIFILFDRRDGITNDELGLASAYRLPDGRLIFGGSYQFTVFQPADIQITDETPPHVVVTDFILNSRALRPDSLFRNDRIKLKYDQNSIAIEFSTMQFISPYLVRYQMEGLDKDWQIANRSQSISYSYLPPGDYTLLLRAEDTEGHIGPVTRLVLSIDPPFWKTWWFYSLLVLLAGTLFFWIDRERISRKEALYSMRTDLADELHKEVNLALNNINILSEMARLKADKDTTKAVEYIEQIHIKSQAMINTMEDMLWTISPENDSMARNIDHFREHIDALKSRYETDIDLLVDKRVNELKLDMKLRQNILRLFKGGITNFIRTGGKDCKIHITLEKSHLVYTVEFDNTHSDMQQLNNLVKRQELETWLRTIHAHLDFQTRSTRSYATLTIPLR